MYYIIYEKAPRTREPGSYVAEWSLTTTMAIFYYILCLIASVFIKNNYFRRSGQMKVLVFGEVAQTRSCFFSSKGALCVFFFFKGGAAPFGTPEGGGCRKVFYFFLPQRGALPPLEPPGAAVVGRFFIRGTYHPFLGKDVTLHIHSSEGEICAASRL